MDIGCMHANENNTLPTGIDAEIMKSFVVIGHGFMAGNIAR